MSIDYTRNLADGAVFAGLKSYNPMSMIGLSLPGMAIDLAYGMAACYVVDYFMYGGYGDYMTSLIRGGAIALGGNQLPMYLPPQLGAMGSQALGAALGGVAAEYMGY